MVVWIDPRAVNDPAINTQTLTVLTVHTVNYICVCHDYKVGLSHIRFSP